MKRQRFFGRVLVLALMAALSGAVIGSASTPYPGPDLHTQPWEQVVEGSTRGRAQGRAASEAIMVDHTCTDIPAIPQGRTYR